MKKRSRWVSVFRKKTQPTHKCLLWLFGVCFLMQVLAACADLLDSEVRGWIESLARWVEDGSKLPQQQSEDVEERRQAIRWIAAQRSLSDALVTLVFYVPI